MNDRFSAPWHKESFDRLMTHRLPELLAARLPLAGYSIQSEDARACRVMVEIGAGAGETAGAVRVEYPGLPQPDDEGRFWLEGGPLESGRRSLVAYVVVPVASTEALDQATVQCAGEQLYDYIAAHLGQAPAGVAWDEATVRALLPLDTLFAGFLREKAQLLDVTNWHARYTHLRRILIPGRTRVIAPGQQGRVDPFETPEGPNIGKVFTIAMGAAIRDGKIAILDPRPEAGLGHNAVQIPFLEHDDANRLLMGVNMMRQALVPPEPEPALVQTGNAPAGAGADFWCGRNLLTAFIAWGEGSTEDGLILSETCARQRLNFPYPAEPGDKLANRHGTKGVVAQVLPDAQMPRRADGTPVEIIFSFSGMHNRMNFGQVREAVMGLIARAEGQPAIVPPFHAPSTAELLERLDANGLSSAEPGMERLSVGDGGQELTYPATVGWVYWYRLAHLARPKLYVAGGAGQEETARPDQGDVYPHPVFPPWQQGQALGEMELAALRQVGARHNAREMVTTRSLKWRAAAGSEPVPSPYFQALAARLAAAGIALTLEPAGEGAPARYQMALRFAPPQGADALGLARRLRHPWLREASISQVGAPPANAGLAAARAFTALAQANDRLARWLEKLPGARPAEDSDPETTHNQSAYLDRLFEQVEARLADYFDALLPAEALRLSEVQAFSGRAVISPGTGLRLDQVGLPEEMARVLFRERALAGNLDRVMAESWVIIHRGPALTPSALLAFHPHRVAGPSIRLHPQACALLNADFDGDQLAVYLPLSPEAQQEAGEKLSIAGHLAHMPELAPALLPPHEGLWGLAYLSLSAEGRRQIAGTPGLAGLTVAAPVSQSDLAEALGEVLRLRGAEALVETANALARLGYAAVDAAGASLSPFASSQVPLPPLPETDDPGTWEIYTEACAEAILSGRDYANPNLGPQLLSAATRQRSRRFLPLLVGPRGLVVDAAGQPVIVRHSLVEGRTAEELYATVAGAREGLARLAFESEEILRESMPARRTGGAVAGGAITVLARARRAQRPGLVFARAAASGETDPLTDQETRLLVGLE